MLYGNRNDTREIFFTAWQKHKNNEHLEALEQQIVTLIHKHPEYHRYLNDSEKYHDKDFSPEVGETNPFLHLSLHLAINDQLTLDQPSGIREAYQQLLQVFADPHEVEHCIMNSLALGLWDSAKQGNAFDSDAYLERIKQAIKDKHW